MSLKFELWSSYFDPFLILPYLGQEKDRNNEYVIHFFLKRYLSFLTRLREANSFWSLKIDQMFKKWILLKYNPRFEQFSETVKKWIEQFTVQVMTKHLTSSQFSKLLYDLNSIRLTARKEKDQDFERFDQIIPIFSKIEQLDIQDDPRFNFYRLIGNQEFPNCRSIENMHSSLHAPKLKDLKTGYSPIHTMKLIQYPLLRNLEISRFISSRTLDYLTELPNLEILKCFIKGNGVFNFAAFPRLRSLSLDLIGEDVLINSKTNLLFPSQLEKIRYGIYFKNSDIKLLRIELKGAPVLILDSNGRIGKDSTIEFVITGEAIRDLTFQNINSDAYQFYSVYMNTQALQRILHNRNFLIYEQESLDKTEKELAPINDKIYQTRVRIDFPSASTHSSPYWEELQKYLFELSNLQTLRIFVTEATLEQYIIHRLGDKSKNIDKVPQNYFEELILRVVNHLPSLRLLIIQNNKLTVKNNFKDGDYVFPSNARKNLQILYGR